MKVACSTLVVAASIKSTVDAFQVPLGSKITGPTQGHKKTQSSFRTTTTASLLHPRSLPFLSKFRLSASENEKFGVDEEEDDSDSAANGHHESIVDQLSLEEQKELILQQLSMVDDDDDDHENDSDIELSLEEQKELILQQLSMVDEDDDEDDSDFEMEEQDRDNNVRSVSFNVEDVGYYNYYDEDDSSQPMDQSKNDFDDYYYDDDLEDLPPRERRRRKRQREAASSLAATASDLAETAIRIGGKATNVAKKTTGKALQRLVENTFQDKWDEEEYQPRNPPPRPSSAGRPSRRTARPMSRYERDRIGAPSPRPKQQRTPRRNGDDFKPYRSQDEEKEEYVQRDSYRSKRDPRRGSPRKPIEKTADSFDPSDTFITSPSRRQRTEISKEGDVENRLEEEMNLDDTSRKRTEISNKGDVGNRLEEEIKNDDTSRKRTEISNKGDVGNRLEEEIKNDDTRRKRTEILNEGEADKRLEEINNDDTRRKRTEILNEGEADNRLEEEINNDDTSPSAKSEDPSWKSILEKTSKVASKKAKAIPRKIVNKAERTAQKAKEMSYKAVSDLLEDEDEEEGTKVDPVVMDAVIEDKQEERIVDVEAIPMGEWPSNAWSKSQHPPNPSSRSETMRDATFERPPRPKSRKRSQASSSSASRRRRRPRPRRPQQSGSSVDGIVTSGRNTAEPSYQEEEQKYYYGLFQLPPAEGAFQQATMDQEPSTESSRRRKVYSPYDSNRRRRNPNGYDGYEDPNDMYTDGVDRMGNFVAEALDTFLWGREDGEDRPNRRARGRNAAASGRGQATNNQSKSTRHKRSGHWKDRMEEQFDEFLGIHEGGEYYDRWATQESELDDVHESNRKNTGTGRDPVSFARGEVPRGKSRNRSRPIWEQEDSLLSVLFGTDHDTAERNARMYRSSSNLPFLGNGGSLLRVVQSLAESLALVAGRVSQWASVRGSVPQPVIVVGLVSALLSARPGKRWQTVLFATLALRMLGELMHNYMYDDLDFEDDLSVVNHKGDRDMDNYDGMY